ncbi:Hypothetical predicted protein, partial [Pelobates cultripes]
SNTILQRCWFTPKKPKALSDCYRALMMRQPDTEFPFAKQWSRELGREQTPEEWTSKLNASKGVTRCYSYIEAHRKLICRWYLTPQRLHQ